MLQSDHDDHHVEHPAGPDTYAEEVLEMVEHIPPGRVMSYGDIAEYIGNGGPRQVGAVMSAWGGECPGGGWYARTEAPGGHRHALCHLCGRIHADAARW